MSCLESRLAQGLLLLATLLCVSACEGSSIGSPLEGSEGSSQASESVSAEEGRERLSDALIVAEGEGSTSRDAFQSVGSDIETRQDASSSSERADALAELQLPEGKAAYTCEEDSQCGGCAGSGVCEGGLCTYTSEGCVIKDPEGELASCYPDNAPAPDSNCLHCRANVASDRWSGVWYAASFESGLSPFVWVETYGKKEVTWHVSESNAHDGLFSARFANTESGTYVSSGRSWGRMSTEVMSGQDGVNGMLSFWLWLETEETPGYDVLSVLLLTPSSEDLLWSSESIDGTTEGDWLRINIPVQGPPDVPTQIAIEFDSGDSIINGYQGPFIDGLTLSTNCCLSDSDCVTGNVCLSGACGSDGQCAWTPTPGCCYEDDQCPQIDPCMKPICSGPGGTCGAEPIENCCIEASDCDDTDPCTQEVCAYPGALCENRPLCCGSSIQCISDNPCFQGTCEGNECVYVDRCCESDADCEDGNVCTTATCFDQLCLTSVLPIEGCCIEEVFFEDFDSGIGLAGWSFQGIVGGVGWSVVTPPATTLPSPPAALYYGNPSTWNYDSGGSNDGKVWTPFLMLPMESEITLSFDLLLDVQTQNTLDTFTVLIHGPSGWEEVIEKPGLLVGYWQEVSLDVSALAGHAVQLAFEFRTMNSEDNSGMGVFIDDLTLKTTCSKRACQQDSDCPSTDSCMVGSCEGEGGCVYEDICCNSDLACDDANPCTIDNCIYQHCENEEIPYCCASSEDCDDGDGCTLNVCSGPGGTCFFPEIDGCCQSSSECDDGVTCTSDQCLDNVCAHINLCCSNDADCDDGDDICTTDECTDGFCVYAPTGLSGCCLSEPLFWDFESSLDFEMSATSPPCAWQIVDTGKASSGSISMYYGDLESMSFACGHNAGTATSSEITLIEGVAYTLTFQANIDVESNTVYDTLDLYALVNGTEAHFWDKSEMIATDAWYSYSVDISALAGQTFRLRFSFDTHDDVANESTGIYIDDLQITSTCLAKPCVDDQGCDDGVVQTTESCGLDGCEYAIP